MRILLFLSFIVFTSATNKVTTFVKKQKGADFTKYKTFAWIAPYDTVEGQHVRKRPYEHFIVQQVDKQMLAKGYKLDSLHPDIVLMYDAHITREEKERQQSNVTVGVAIYMPYYYGSNYYGGYYFDPEGYRNQYYPINSVGYYGGYYIQATQPVNNNKPPTKYVVEEGNIVFNVFDVKTKQVIWSAGAKEKVNIETDLGSDLNLAIESTFGKFPTK